MPHTARSSPVKPGLWRWGGPGANVPAVIDLHCHLLPGVDDGPATVEISLQMARAALDEGIHTVVATPHVNLEYGVVPEEIEDRVEALQAALAAEGLPLHVFSGAEVALNRCGGFSDAELRRLCLGRSSYALIESPYSRAGSLIEDVLFDLQVRGFRPLLAHPERCPEFQSDLPRLERLVDRGIACSVSAGSLVGQFGRTVKRFACRLLDEQLVHNLSSDAHDPARRPLSLRVAAGDRSRQVMSPAGLRWLTETVPAGILADEPLPARRRRPSERSPWSRLLARG